MPTYTSFPRSSQARESTRFWKIEVQVGTKQNRPLDRANARESARRGSFNRTVVEQYTLLDGNADVAWNATDCDAYLNGLVDLWNDW